MPRVKRSASANKKRKSTLKQTKGFMWGRKNKYKAAKDALRHALSYAYRDRKNKKRTNRGLWQIKINAATRQQGLTYSKFIAGLKATQIELDRKILADLAENNPTVFAQIVELVKAGNDAPKAKEKTAPKASSKTTKKPAAKATKKEATSKK